MRRLVLVSLLALAPFAGPGAAFGKELQSVTLCGASGCTTLTHEQSAPFIAVFESGSGQGPTSVLDAVPVGPYYKLGFKIRGDRSGSSFSFVMWYVRPDLLRQQDRSDALDEPFRRIPERFARELEGIAKNVEPFPAPRVIAASINGKPVGRPAELIGLFHKLDGIDARADDDRGGAWVNISLTPDRKNPWFKRNVEFLYRTKAQALFLAKPVRVPDELADAIARDAELHADDHGRAREEIVIGVLAAWLVAAAGVAVAARRRRRTSS